MKKTCARLLAALLLLALCLGAASAEDGTVFTDTSPQAAEGSTVSAGTETQAAEGGDRLDLANDTVFFGTYPQTAEGGEEPIEWIVLDKGKSAALLLSRYALDDQPFHNSFLEKIYWDNCSLRVWLNEDFLNKAFTPEEQKALYQVNVDNGLSQGRPNGGNTSVARETTKDYVFLLSWKEAFETYFKKDEDRVCLMTDYVFQVLNYGKAYKKKDGKGIAGWWLRSPTYPKAGMLVTYKGNMTDQNNIGRCGIRPAIIIDLDADCFKR